MVHYNNTRTGRLPPHGKDEAACLPRATPAHANVRVRTDLRPDFLRWGEARETAETSQRAFPGHGRPWDEELTRPRKENKVLKSANEILKKAAAIFVQMDTP